MHIVLALLAAALTYFVFMAISAPMLISGLIAALVFLVVVGSGDRFTHRI